jgi:ADP-ribosylglycohydrolase
MTLLIPMNDDSARGALMGALTADAATLGLHWLYDPERITSVIAREGSAAFVPIDAANYADVLGYFAHPHRRQGMLSQYGECLRLAIDVINEGKGQFDVGAYQQAFVNHFDMGGTYVGYIDRPTRAAVANILAKTSPSGSDDDQLPALTRIPAIVTALHGKDVVMETVDHAVAITNVNEDAHTYGRVFAELLSRVLNGEKITAALQAVTTAAPESAQGLLNAALQTDEDDSVAYGAITERACHLSQGMPLAFHILRHATDYADAVTRNIAAGGDSCGRSIVIGAVMGAAVGFDSLPRDWIANLHDVTTLQAACDQLASRPLS